MGPCLGGQVHNQAFSRLAQPACDQADFFQAVPDRLGAEMKAFSARKRDPIDLVRDFINEDLCLT